MLNKIVYSIRKESLKTLIYVVFYKCCGTVISFTRPLQSDIPVRSAISTRNLGSEEYVIARVRLVRIIGEAGFLKNHQQLLFQCSSDRQAHVALFPSGPDCTWRHSVLFDGAGIMSWTYTILLVRVTLRQMNICARNIFRWQRRQRIMH
ncbi:hypothetical protein F4703DRAFT_1790809 [Phycomyces blakesleeanus]|uniref:Uncharacterized protein n=1 Tax=Phycomyces blakesleeanus (strain ATCC 8743b / DSM 1359 / FGSC 10004 / NBRC 33097 / NRRL 1555) TaxID=763407 RepID=A0A162Y0B8_PHYB8|nr:hypothetical protein PHYBLDRAFT_60677 [Phycomyces blakesleeanus NRRL 1555(-)]OAD77545.1 hypothetical protein PHYBLDRAFT_60677 [Phycomyces blakesleeanus NRRL 1555(-)]|eukprot:XP_018295585.1 hypothetical protein PHYBLDRAFT_60677 [Phycomyces blakesleeanus NRRL 1555(-)]